MTEFSRTDREFQHQFRAIEPDFDFLASYGEAIVPVLEELLAGDDELMAVRAVYLAGMLPDAAGFGVLKRAVDDARDTVRVAVAGALRQVGSNALSTGTAVTAPDEAKPILLELLGDSDASVRRWASKSAGMMGFGEVRDALSKLEHDDEEESVRAAAGRALKDIAKGER